MRLKTLFWILFALVFGLLTALGFLFAKSNLKLFFLIEGITLLAIILFILFYNLLLKPIRTINNGMDLLKTAGFFIPSPSGWARRNRLFNRNLQ